jgi:membrane associated rhomboid family serine protease
VLVPLRTDAPVYHRPWATGGIIAVDFVVHVWTQWGVEPPDIRHWVLRYGEWAPWQWLTSVFLHAGWLHLLGNMLFLWVFGLVVEGKIGWWRFLALFGAIAVASGFLEQTLMLRAQGGSLGASGVIFGLIGVAMVWAPENEVECLFVIYPWIREVELSIRSLGLLYLAIEFVPAALFGFRMTAPMLHLIGAAVGVPIGVAMLRRGWVNCEGWDWFSRRDYRPSPIGAASRRSHAPEPAAHAAVRQAAAEPATIRFAILMKAGDVDGALRVHSECGAAERSTLDAPARARLIRALVDAGRVVDARPVIASVLHDDSGNPDVGLLEAGLLVNERRPSKAGQVLAAIAGRLKDERQVREHADLAAKAERLRAEGALELDD